MKRNRTGTLPHNMRPLFIVLEGPDGGGTTLHSALLAKRLEAQGLKVLCTFEPTDGPIGTAIRNDLDTGATFSPLELQKRFCSDRAWHLKEVISPALRAGSTVISDRYTPSTLAYGEALGIRREELEKLNKDFIQPSLVFLLMPPFDVCIRRLKSRAKLDALEEATFQRRVYDLYARMAEADPSMIVIDTSGPKHASAEEIYRNVKLKMENVK